MHDRSGCTMCPSSISCKNKDKTIAGKQNPCSCVYHVKELEIQPYKFELKMRKKAIGVKDFPYNSVS